MKGLNSSIMWFVGVAVAVLLAGSGMDLQAQSPTGPYPGKGLASGGQEGRSAKAKPKRPRLRMPELPDVAKEPSPPTGPVPIPYPNIGK